MQPKMNPFEVVLRTRDTIRLCSLQQELTYAGLLEGLPIKDMDRRTLDWVVSRTAKRIGRAPWLVEPTSTPVPWSGDQPYPFGEPAMLPEVVCAAEFQSSQHEQSGLWGYSRLTVIWFQNEWALPIAPDAIDGIQQIDWTAIAHSEEL